jgi:hypothetical protein
MQGASNRLAAVISSLWPIQMFFPQNNLRLKVALFGMSHSLFEGRLGIIPC